MMKLMWFILTIILIGSLILGGCAPAGTSAGKLVIPALPPGSSWYSMMLVLSQVINKNTDLTAIVEPLTNPLVFADLMMEGNAHLMMLQADLQRYTFTGKKGKLAPAIWPETRPAYPGMRLLMGGNNGYYGVVTGEFTGIKNLQQLRGKKFAMLYPTLSAQQYAEAMLKHLGIDPTKDLTALEYPFPTGALVDLSMKKIDAVITTLGGSKVVEADAKVGIIWLPIDQETVDYLHNIDSDIESAVAGTYIPGVKQPTQVIKLLNSFLCDKSLDEKVAYQIVKAICEHAKEAAGATWEVTEWTKERAIVTNAFVPYHPGAIKYFKEQGMWTSELDALQTRLLSELPK